MSEYSVDKRKYVDLKLISDEVKKNEKNIEKLKGKDAPFLLGETGGGKTTLSAMLAGHEIKSVKVPTTFEIDGEKMRGVDKEVLDVEDKQSFKYKIGHEKVSCTASIQISDLDEKRCVCDTPGFLDTNLVRQSVVNSVLIYKAMKACGKLRPVVLLNAMRLDKGFKGRAFTTLIRHLLSFMSIEMIKNHVHVFFTHAEEGKQGLLKVMQGLAAIRDSSEGSNEERKVIAIFLDRLKRYRDSLILHPAKLKNSSTSNILKNLIFDPTFLRPITDKENIGIPLDDDARSQIEKEAMQLNNDIALALKDMDFRAVAKCLEKSNALLEIPDENLAERHYKAVELVNERAKELLDSAQVQIENLEYAKGKDQIDRLIEGNKLFGRFTSKFSEVKMLKSMLASKAQNLYKKVAIEIQRGWNPKNLPRMLFESISLDVLRLKDISKHFSGFVPSTETKYEKAKKILEDFIENHRRALQESAKEVSEISKGCKDFDSSRVDSYFREIWKTSNIINGNYMDVKSGTQSLEKAVNDILPSALDCWKKLVEEGLAWFKDCKEDVEEVYDGLIKLSHFLVFDEKVQEKKEKKLDLFGLKAKEVLALSKSGALASKISAELKKYRNMLLLLKHLAASCPQSKNVEYTEMYLKLRNKFKDIANRLKRKMDSATEDNNFCISRITGQLLLLCADVAADQEEELHFTVQKNIGKTLLSLEKDLGKVATVYQRKLEDRKQSESSIISKIEDENDIALRNRNANDYKNIKSCLTLLNKTKGFNNLIDDLQQRMNRESCYEKEMKEEKETKGDEKTVEEFGDFDVIGKSMKTITRICEELNCDKVKHGRVLETTGAIVLTKVREEFQAFVKRGKRALKGMKYQTNYSLLSALMSRLGEMHPIAEHISKAEMGSFQSLIDDVTATIKKVLGEEGGEENEQLLEEQDEDKKRDEDKKGDDNKSRLSDISKKLAKLLRVNKLADDMLNSVSKIVPQDRRETSLKQLKELGNHHMEKFKRKILASIEKNVNLAYRIRDLNADVPSEKNISSLKTLFDELIALKSMREKLKNLRESLKLNEKTLVSMISNAANQAAEKIMNSLRSAYHSTLDQINDDVRRRKISADTDSRFEFLKNMSRIQTYDEAINFNRTIRTLNEDMIKQVNDEEKKIEYYLSAKNYDGLINSYKGFSKGGKVAVQDQAFLHFRKLETSWTNEFRKLNIYLRGLSKENVFYSDFMWKIQTELESLIEANVLAAEIGDKKFSQRLQGYIKNFIGSLKALLEQVEKFIDQRKLALASRAWSFLQSFKCWDITEDSKCKSLEGIEDFDAKYKESNPFHFLKKSIDAFEDKHIKSIGLQLKKKFREYIGMTADLLRHWGQRQQKVVRKLDSEDDLSSVTTEKSGTITPLKAQKSSLNMDETKDEKKTGSLFSYSKFSLQEIFFGLKPQTKLAKEETKIKQGTEITNSKKKIKYAKLRRRGRSPKVTLPWKEMLMDAIRENSVTIHYEDARCLLKQVDHADEMNYFASSNVNFKNLKAELVNDVEDWMKKILCSLRGLQKENYQGQQDFLCRLKRLATNCDLKEVRADLEGIEKRLKSNSEMRVFILFSWTIDSVDIFIEELALASIDNDPIFESTIDRLTSEVINPKVKDQMRENLTADFISVFSVLAKCNNECSQLRDECPDVPEKLNIFEKPMKSLLEHFIDCMKKQISHYKKKDKECDMLSLIKMLDTPTIDETGLTPERKGTCTWDEEVCGILKGTNLLAEWKETTKKLRDCSKEKTEIINTDAQKKREALRIIEDLDLIAENNDIASLRSSLKILSKPRHNLVLGPSPEKIVEDKITKTESELSNDMDILLQFNGNAMDEKKQRKAFKSANLFNKNLVDLETCLHTIFLVEWAQIARKRFRLKVGNLYDDLKKLIKLDDIKQLKNVLNRAKLFEKNLSTVLPSEKIQDRISEDIIYRLSKKIKEKFKVIEDNASPYRVAKFLDEIYSQYAELADKEINGIVKGQMINLIDRLETHDFNTLKLGEMLGDRKEYPKGDLVISGIPHLEFVNTRQINIQFNKAAVKLDSALNFLKEQKENNIGNSEIMTLKGLYEKYENTYNECIDSYLKIPSAKITDLIKEIKRISSLYLRKDWSQFAKILPDFLARVSAVYTVHHSKRPYLKTRKNIDIKKMHCVQVLTILRLLGADTKTGTFTTAYGKLENHLVQIVTGGGKSIALGISATIFALLGYNVDCACYSKFLSDRDENEFNDFWKLFGISPKIKYSTMGDLANRFINREGDIRELTKKLVLNKKYEKKKVTSLAKKTVLLIDEVDVTFQEEFLGRSYNAVTHIYFDEMKNIMQLAWKERKDIKPEKLRNMNEYKILVSKFGSAFMKSLSKSLVRDLKAVEGHKYIATSDGIIGYRKHQTITTHTYYGYTTAFCYLKELEKKNPDFLSRESEVNEKVGSISFACGSFSYAEIPELYGVTVGVTGTLQPLSKYEKDKIIKEKFNIKKMTIMKPIYGTTKLTFAKNKNVKVLGDKGSFHQALQIAIQEQMEQKRATLVFFKTADAMRAFEQSKEGLDFRQPRLKCIDEECLNIDAAVVEATTLKNAATLFPRVFGRGLDFRNRETGMKGGVHVIQAFFSKTLSEEIQIKGRTARQGDYGSYEIIALSEDVQKDFGLEAKDLKEKFDNDGGAGLYTMINDRREKMSKEDLEKRMQRVEAAKARHLISMQYRVALLQGSKNRDAALKLQSEL